MEMDYSSGFLDSSQLEDETTSGADLIRDSIKDKVDNILWLDNLAQEEKAYNDRLNKRRTNNEKCMVCTLPYGTCVHTQQWIKDTYQTKQNAHFDQSLDQSIDDMLSVMGDFQIETAPIPEEVDLSQMQWNLLEQTPVDQIGASKVALFAPDERGWHSSVKLANLVYVFGGFKYRNKAVPQPFTSIPAPEEVQYLNDIRVYDTQNMAWHGVKARGIDGNSANSEEDPILQPEGRYGHAAAALDDQRMLIFGGRGSGGRILNDTWVYHRDLDRWQLVQNNEALQLPVPPPRFFSSAVSLQIPHPHRSRATSSVYSKLKVTDRDVYLFGGTDGMDNFGDLWVFRGSASALRWERIVAVGLPPCPRYGHQMVVLHEGEEGDEFNQQLMVLGGCFVSPQGEMVGSNLGPAETLQLMALSSELRSRYAEESRLAHISGAALESSVLYGSTSATTGGNAGDGSPGRNKLGDLFHQSATSTAALHLVEQNTRIAENNMINAYKTSLATTTHNIKKARHPNPLLDAYVLNVGELMWRSQTYPGVRGSIPSARIHFSSACIGHFVFVLGGAEPTSLKYKHTELSSVVYVCDSRSMKWSVVNAINSNDHLKEPMRIAQADVIRAVRRCDEEKLRGISLGALNGRTIELAEAQAVLEVCKWRQSMLTAEQAEVSVAPRGRWGGSLTAQGQRMLYIGGWEVDRAVPKDKSVVLNVEQQHERRRRLDDEYNARLNKDRIRELAEANMANCLSVFELRAMRELEEKNRQRDLKDMHYEDILSALPPLSKPESVQLVKANQHTMWVKWPRIIRNSARALLDPDSITYYLYMRTGFENIQLGDRVFATVEPVLAKKGPKKALHQLRKSAHFRAFDDLNVCFDDDCKRYPGEVVRVSGDGKFDVAFDDGTAEKNLPRHRLKLAPPLDLAMVPLLSRPSTTENAINRNTSLSRPGTSESVSSTTSSNKNHQRQHTAQMARPGTINTNNSSLENNAVVVIGSPSRGGARAHSRSASPSNRPGTADSRATLNAALLQASIQNISTVTASNAVVPLEFAQTTRNRLTQRENRKLRNNEQLDKLFRNITGPTEEELRARNRAEKVERNAQRRAEKALERDQLGSKGGTYRSLTSSALGAFNDQSRAQSPLSGITNTNYGTNVGSNSAYKTHYGGNGNQHSNNNRNDNNANGSKLRRQGSNVSFDDTIHTDDPFGFVSDIIFTNKDGNVHDYFGEDYSSYDINSTNSYNGDHTTQNTYASNTTPYTVKVDPRWKLVYVGNENTYSCTNLVSDDVLLRESDIRVPVAFCYQVHGADVPLYERSQLSSVAIFQTLPPNHAVSSGGSGTSGTAAVKGKSVGVSKGTSGVLTSSNNSGTGTVGKHTKAIATSKSMNGISAKTSMKVTANSTTSTHNINNSTASATNTNDSSTDTATTNTTNTATTTTMSRTKKEIVSAVISGQQLIQIEKLNNYCQSHGVSDNYM